MKTNYLYIWGFLSLWLLSGSLVYSQQYPLTVIDYDDGLAKSSIYEVAKDPQGYMWMASDASVIRYDGSNFRYYTVRDGFSGNYVLDIDFDQNKNMWISTYGGGIACFDGNSFHSYNPTNGFPASYVRSLLFSRDGDLWAATEDMGVVRVRKGKAPEIVLQKNGNPFLNPWSILEDDEGDIWVAAISGIGEFEKSKNYEYEARYVEAFTFTSVSKDIHGNIWGGGAYNLVKIGKDSVTNLTHLMPPGTILLDIHASKTSDKIYLGTVSNLLILENDSITVLDKSSGLSNTQFWDIYEDENKEIWLSSAGGGAVKYDKRGITIYDHQGDVSFESMIYDIVEDNQGRLIFGTEMNGYFYYENGQFKKFEEPAITAIRSSYATAHNTDYSTTILTSTTGFIYWMKNGKIIGGYEPDKEHVKLAYDIEFIDSLQLMILSDDGCYTIAPGYPERVKMTEIPSVFCRTVFTDDQGYYWILGDKGEIFKWKDGKMEPMQGIINPQNYNLWDGYYDPFHRLYWFCTNAGLIVWNGKNTLVLHAKNGLNSDMPVSIAQDRQRRIWVGHDRGLTCIDVDKRTFSYLGYDQGFRTVITNLRTLLVDRKGELWAGSVDNLYQINLDQLIPENKHTQLRLQEVKFRDKVYFRETYFQDSIPPLDLQYNENNLQINLCALDFVNAAKVKYTWKLKGYDKDFMPYTYAKQVNYTNLEPGDYEFIAKAIDSDGFETNEVKIKIHIEKPFWERIWFYALEVFIFGMIVFLSFLFTSKSSDNRFGQVMTFLTIIILFESSIFYLSGFINPLTNGIPIFQLVMNIILAAILQPVEKLVKRLMNRTVEKKKKI